jgi:hypothetical protein
MTFRGFSDAGRLVEYSAACLQPELINSVITALELSNDSECILLLEVGPGELRMVQSDERLEDFDVRDGQSLYVLRRFCKLRIHFTGMQSRTM